MNRAVMMLMCTSCVLSPQVVSIIETQAQYKSLWGLVKTATSMLN